MLNAKPSAAASSAGRASGRRSTSTRRADDLDPPRAALLADHELNASSTFTAALCGLDRLEPHDPGSSPGSSCRAEGSGSTAGAGVLAAQLLKTLADGEFAPCAHPRARRARRTLRGSALASTAWRSARQVVARSTGALSALTASLHLLNPGTSSREATGGVLRSISIMRFRCWCTRSAGRLATNWCRFRWPARWMDRACLAGAGRGMAG